MTSQRASQRSTRQPKQSGMVLAIALILISVMLVVVSASLRWSGTEQSIAGNLRDHEIAYQAAEMGLKACELRLEAFDAKGNDISYRYSIAVTDQDPYPHVGTKFYWETPANWNVAPITGPVLGALANVYKGPVITSNGASSNVTIANVVQEPRCIIENYALQPANTEEIVATTPAYRITARGVGQRGSSANPTTPVYLQSILRM